jgi:hypothetical protein
MRKLTAKHSRKSASRRTKADKPLEFDRGWHELEAQADRLKYDWGSLAAQLGIGDREPVSFE